MRIPCSIPALLVLSALMLSTLHTATPSNAQEAETTAVSPIITMPFDFENEKVYWAHSVNRLSLRGWPNTDPNKLDQLCNKDELLSFDGVEIRDNDHLVELLESAKPGQTVKLKVSRRFRESSNRDDTYRILTVPITLQGASTPYRVIFEGGARVLRHPAEIHPEWNRSDPSIWEEALHKASGSLSEEEIAAANDPNPLAHEFHAQTEIDRLAACFADGIAKLPGHFLNDEVYYLLRRPFDADKWPYEMHLGFSYGDLSDILSEMHVLSRRYKHAGGWWEYDGQLKQQFYESDDDYPLELSHDATLEEIANKIAEWLDLVDSYYAQAFAPMGEAADATIQALASYHPMRENPNLMQALLEVRKIDWQAFDQALWLSRSFLAEYFASKLESRLEHQQEFDPSLLADGGEIGSLGNDQHEGAPRILIDLGGNDTYDMMGAEYRRSSIIIDLSGDDHYRGDDGSIGCGLAASGFHIDLAGNDVYATKSCTQGYAVLGLGVLADLAGNDRYTAHENAQGVALIGLGLLYDEEGNDSYSARAFSQAVGYSRGFGGLIDLQGHDQYTCGNHYPSPYGDEGQFLGVGQGVGYGFRNQEAISCGGIGGLVDGAGKDTFTCGQFGLGFGYFFGLGFVLNNESDWGLYADSCNDVYRASRYCLGSAAHYAVGIVRDERGDDHYETGGYTAIGSAWDMSVGSFIDDQGNDYYKTWLYAMGGASQNAYGLFLDREGDDVYAATDESTVNQSYARRLEGGTTYGAGRGARNLGVFVDLDGDDTYMGEVHQNNSTSRSDDKPFIIWSDQSKPEQEEDE